MGLSMDGPAAYLWALGRSCIAGNPQDRMMRIRCSVSGALLCLATILTASAASAQIRPDTMGSGIAWRLVPESGISRVSGRVVTVTGDPLPSAMVVIGTDRLKVLTDSAGAFEVRIPTPGDWRIEATLLGYGTALDSLRIPPGFSVFVVAVLPEFRIPLCGLRFFGAGYLPDDLNIKVVDAVTGEVPAGEATLRLEHGDSVWERTSTLGALPATPGIIGLGRRITTYGSHDIEVRVPGYMPWRLEDVELWLIDDGCDPMLTNNTHDARLVRESQ